MRGRVTVVDERDVDTRDAEPLQAVLDAAANAGRRIVPVLHEWKYVDIAVLVARRVDGGCKDASDLGRQYACLHGHRTEHRAETMLAQAVAVVRRGIETASTIGDGRLQHLA